ncbi:Uncharacterised protein [Bordetella pertussis]|nr:Uncharacterised protein [Bordetella pertussis]
MRWHAMRVHTPSISAISSQIANSSCTSMRATTAPPRGWLSTMPWTLSCSSASRTGVRETWWRAASACSSMASPGSRTPLRISASSASRMRSLTFMA